MLSRESMELGTALGFGPDTTEPMTRKVDLLWETERSYVVRDHGASDSRIIQMTVTRWAPSSSGRMRRPSPRLRLLRKPRRASRGPCSAVSPGRGVLLRLALRYDGAPTIGGKEGSCGMVPAEEGGSNSGQGSAFNTA